MASIAATDWRQQQWFALFREVNAAYEFLDRVYSTRQTLGGHLSQILRDEINAATLQMKKAQGLATVFPRCAEADALFDALKFVTEQDYFRIDLKERLFEASEGIRQKALVHPELVA